MNNFNKITLLAFLSTLSAHASDDENKVNPAAEVLPGETPRQENPLNRGVLSLSEFGDDQVSGKVREEAYRARDESTHDRPQENPLNRAVTSLSELEDDKPNKSANDRRQENPLNRAVTSLSELDDPKDISSGQVPEKVREEAYQARNEAASEKVDSGIDLAKGDSPKAKALRALKDVKIDPKERDKLVYAVEHEKDALDATSDFKKGSDAYKAKPLNDQSKLREVLQRPLVSNIANDKAYFELDKDVYVDPYVLGRVEGALKGFPKANFEEVINAKKVIEDFNKKIEDLRKDKASYDDKTKQSLGSKLVSFFKKNTEKEERKNDAEDFWKDADTAPRRNR